MRSNLDIIINNQNLKNKLSYLLNGSNRIKIYLSLLKEIKTACEIEIETNISLPSICRSLKGMLRNEIIQCLDFDQKQGKLYRLASDIISLEPVVTDKAKKKRLI